jgi:predicted RNase H-like nuclease (RuvC/YqgF family)
VEADLAAARKEVLEVHEELARLKGKLAASEMALGESGGSVSSLREKAEALAQKLDTSRRNEKKLKNALQERTAEMKAAEATHRKRIEDLEDRLEALSAGYDYVDIVEPLDWDGTLEAAKAAKILAKELSVDARGPARETLRTVARRCDQIYLELEAERDEEAARLDDMFRGKADFAAVLRLVEIHNRMAHVSVELTYLSMLTSVFMPDQE